VKRVIIISLKMVITVNCEDWRCPTKIKEWDCLNLHLFWGRCWFILRESKIRSSKLRLKYCYPLYTPCNRKVYYILIYPNMCIHLHSNLPISLRSYVRMMDFHSFQLKLIILIDWFNGKSAYWNKLTECGKLTFRILN
jgi:hypothetical protein